MNLDSELRQVLAQLELVSQVSAVNLDPSSRDSGEDIGGKRPPGGIVAKDDFMIDYPQKSVVHFRHRVRRARNDRQLAEILDEAKAALEACLRQPPPNDEPEYGSPQWKQWVADSPLSHGEIARKFNVTRAYVQKIRRLYQQDAA